MIKQDARTPVLISWCDNYKRRSTYQMEVRIDSQQVERVLWRLLFQ